MTLPKRKLPRLRGYDYSNANYYFVTICTYQKQQLFGTPESLNTLGKIAENDLLAIPQHFPSVRVDKYVIMPNHIHAIFVLEPPKTSAPSLSTVINLYKSGVTRQIHQFLPDKKIWQQSFYDSIIRDEIAYLDIWSYIDGNPTKWQLDELFVE